MDSGLKQRLIGAAVLVALAVIFLPMLVQGPAPDSGVSDVPLTMPDTPQGDYETRDLPLVVPGAAPNGGAVGLDTTADNSDALPTVDTATAPAAMPAAPASQAVPLGDSGVSAPTALPDEPAAVPAKPAAATAAAGAAKPVPAQPVPAQPAPEKPGTMLPATAAGGDYAVHFGSYATSANAQTILRQLRGSQLAGYSERTTLNGKPAYRVRIGPYATRADAEAARLRAAHVRDDVNARVVVLDAEVPASSAPQPGAQTTSVPPRSQPLPPDPVRTASNTTAAPAPVASATAGVGFAVQLGAFSKATDATALRDRLRAAGFTAFTETVNTDKGALTRVRVGPVVSRADADQLRTQVKAKTGVDGLVRPHP